jgi:hypothetical protein
MARQAGAGTPERENRVFGRFRDLKAVQVNVTYPSYQAAEVFRSWMRRGSLRPTELFGAIEIMGSMCFPCCFPGGFRDS